MSNSVTNRRHDGPCRHDKTASHSVPMSLAQTRTQDLIPSRKLEETRLKGCLQYYALNAVMHYCSIIIATVQDDLDRSEMPRGAVQVPAVWKWLSSRRGPGLA